MQKPKMELPTSQTNMTEAEVSASPNGETFPLPTEQGYTEEFKRLKNLVKQQRLMGREIVVFMGVGFVGAVMAGVVADSTDPKTGQPNKFVTGQTAYCPLL
jgi:hypothetical protein